MYFVLVKNDNDKENAPIFIEGISDMSIVESIKSIGGVITECIGVAVELEDMYNRNNKGFIVPPEENGRFINTMNGYKVFIPND